MIRITTHRNNSRGQIAGQIFIYIMAAIIIGAIVLIGYWAISNSVAKGCQVQEITFKNDLESYIDRYSGYGTVRKEALTMPCSYEEVCFVDQSMIGGTGVGFTCANNSVVKEYVSSGDRQNIFLIDSKTTTAIGYSDILALQNPGECLCIMQKNKNLLLTFSGQNSKTQVSSQ